VPIALRKDHGITGDQLHRRSAIHLGITLALRDEVKDDDTLGIRCQQWCRRVGAG
jgi:hypothetical protein